jgi:MFS family permease
MLPPWGVGALVLSGQAMAALDTAIVNVGGPSIQQDLGLSGATLQLTIYSYILVYAILLIIGSRLGGRHGFARMFLAGTALFTLSSLACGLSVSPVMLVISRAAQGLGAGLLVPQVLSLLQTTFDGERRRLALSLYGAVLALGVAVGQTLGGVLVSADLFGSGWRPIFLVNVPVGIVILALSRRGLPTGPEHVRKRLDLTGAGVLGIAMTAILVPLTFGVQAGWPWWSTPCLVGGLAVLVAFYRYEARLAASGREPLLDPGLFSAVQVRLGFIGILVLMTCYGGLLFTIALYLQHALAYSALKSGLTFAGYAVGFAAASLTWARVPAPWHRWVPAAAFTAFAASTAGLGDATSGNGWPWYATVLLTIAGSAHGAGFGALVRQTVESAGPRHAAATSGVLSTVNQLAIVMGIAAMGSLYLSLPPDSSLPSVSWVILVAASGALVSAAVFCLPAGRRRPVSTHET